MVGIHVGDDSEFRRNGRPAINWLGVMSRHASENEDVVLVHGLFGCDGNGVSGRCFRSCIADSNRARPEREATTKAKALQLQAYRAALQLLEPTILLWMYVLVIVEGRMAQMVLSGHSNILNGRNRL